MKFRELSVTGVQDCLNLIFRLFRYWHDPVQVFINKQTDEHLETNGSKDLELVIFTPDRARVYVCVCVCVCVYVFVCVCMYVYECVCDWVYARVHACLFACLQVYLFIFCFIIWL